MNPLQQAAMNRTNTWSGGNPVSMPGRGPVEEAGLFGQLIGQNAQQVQQPPGASPAPGVTGITPGAIERRSGGTTPPSQQVPPPSGPPQLGANPGFQNRQTRMQTPDQLGPSRAQVNAPVGNLEQFLRNLQMQNSQER
jgi:hypothetical protein